MIKRILNWFQTAKPQPTVSDARLQVGCNLEEVSEMLMVFGDEASVEQITELPITTKSRGRMGRSKSFSAPPTPPNCWTPCATKS